MYDIPSFVFPDTTILTQELSDRLLLISKNTKEKEITKAVAELAATRFANNTKRMTDVKTAVETIIYDLLIGKDSFTKQPLVNFGQLGLSFDFWKQLGQVTVDTLLDCAQKV